MIPRPLINIRSKGQRSRSHGQNMQKDDRVAGVSHVLYRVPSLWLLYDAFPHFQM